MRRQFTLAVAAMIAGCTPSPVPTPMPALDSISVNKIWLQDTNGYVYRVGYFTQREIDDADWERTRILHKNRPVIQCKLETERVVRRDLRWYPATARSGQKCAAAVYTVLCGVPSEGPGMDRSRRELLAEEPYNPIERACGSKDRYVESPEECVARDFGPTSCQRMLAENGPAWRRRMEARAKGPTSPPTSSEIVDHERFMIVAERNCAKRPCLATPDFAIEVRNLQCDRQGPRKFDCSYQRKVRGEPGVSPDWQPRSAYGEKGPARWSFSYRSVR